MTETSPLGLHRVLAPAGVLPQAAWQLDPSSPLRASEVAIAVERLNLDAASFRQLSEQHRGDGAAVREQVREIVATRGKMHNPVTGSGGMLLGTVAEVGPDSPLGLSVGDRIATLVSLTCTPLLLDDVSWDGLGEQVPCRGRAVLFARSIAAVLPGDLPDALALAVLDVCGAPALTSRVVSAFSVEPGDAPVVCVIGAGGKSGSLSLAAAREAGAGLVIGVVPTEAERDALSAASALNATAPATAPRTPRADTASSSAFTTPPAPASPGAPLVDVIVVADARDPGGARSRRGRGRRPGRRDRGVRRRARMRAWGRAGHPRPRHGRLLLDGHVVPGRRARRRGDGGRRPPCWSANGYSAGHAELALGLLRRSPGVRALFEARVE